MRHFLKALFFICLSGVAESYCDSLIAQYERQHNIPKNLLRAIAHMESGRNISGQGTVAWPWTINANGVPYVFNTKAQAVAKVKELQRSGVTSIDVGCMQINLKHHPDAFRSIEDAFDPSTNIAYAVRFLKEKMQAQGNWHNAVAHYHSATASHNQPYKNKVIEIWEKLGNAIPQPMQTVFEANQPREINTHFFSVTGRRVPVKIKFAPYTGYKGAIARPVSSPAVFQTAGGIRQNGFFRIKQGQGVGAVKSINEARRGRPPILRTNVIPARAIKG